MNADFASMNAIDMIDTGRTCQLVSKLVRDDKNLDDMIADQLHHVIKIMRTPNLSALDLSMQIAVRCAISEELLVRRAMGKARAA
jgi:hypothetical protein